MIQFNDDDIIIGGVPGFPAPRPYMAQDAPGSYSTNSNVHDGQRKLLVSEIEFLTEVHLTRLHRYDAPDGNPPSLSHLLCVYPGSCPGKHIDRLLKMFPNVFFVLVDPRFGSKQYRAYQTRWDNTRVAVCPHHFDDDTAHAIVEWTSGRGGTEGHWIHEALKPLQIQTEHSGIFTKYCE